MEEPIDENSSHSPNAAVKQALEGVRRARIRLNESTTIEFAKDSKKIFSTRHSKLNVPTAGAVAQLTLETSSTTAARQVLSKY